jgi:crotonobetainyl-CoA:carnitine CoA-transferase CaiB-like acyl-CoA transferase
MTMTITVFDGLRVVDLTHGMAGPLATMILADNGADVVRVVPPESAAYRGDPSRATAGAVQWHRGKRIARLDLRTPEGRVELDRLIADADVLIDSFRPGVLDRLGLDDDELRAANERLITVSITGFGEDGRFRDVAGYEGIVAAATGRMWDLGSVLGLDRPAYIASPVLSTAAAHGVVQGVCAALHVREQTGRGQRVTTSLLRATGPYDAYDRLVGAQLARRDASRPPMPTMDDLTRAQLPAYLPARTSDGSWVQFANWAPHLFWSAATVAGLGALQDDPEFAALPASASNETRETYWRRVLQRIGEVSSVDLLRASQEDGNVGIAPFLTTSDALDHPQARHNGDVVAVLDPEHGETEQIGPIATMSATPSRISAGAAAEPRAEWAGLPADGPAPAHPLAGVLVIEAAQYYAAPYGPSILADLGARVIKIETIDGDPMRFALGIEHTKTLQGKESIAVDIRTPEGQAIVYALVERADIFVHNYRPGVPQRLGLDEETLRRKNPSLIYLYAGAFGEDGPNARMPGYHPIPGAITGAALRQVGAGNIPAASDTVSDDELRSASLRLHRANEGAPDPNTSIAVATAALLGLVARDRHGIGQHIVVTMLAANAYVQSDDWIRYDGKPARPQVDAAVLGTGPLYRLYPTDDGWIFLACTNDTEWAGCATTLGDPRLLREEWRTEAGREADATGLTKILEDVFAARSADDWESLLIPAGVACVRADRDGFGPSLLDEPAFRDTLLVETSDPVFGPYLRQRALTELSAAPASYGPNSQVGDSTRRVLAELGYDDNRVQALLDAGVIGAPD